MLPGLIVKPLKRSTDERGFFTEIMRIDWDDLIGEDHLAQSNFSITYPDIIRAWHRHLRGQNDYFVILKGAAKIGIFDDKTQELSEIVSTSQDLQIIRVPGYYWHGFKALGHEPAFMLYFTNKLYDAIKPDEERRPWNDKKLIPKIINGKKDDPRAGKPWDWNKPPHK